MKNIFKMHVLIIDDDPHSIKLMDRVLHKAGYNKTSTALSVQEATKIISRTPPDLILLDIVMPDMNGLRLCKKIKQDAATRDIPVIMVTGSGVLLDKTITRSFRVGASDYITKPIRGAEFVARIEAALRVKQHGDQIRKELDRRKKAEEALRKSEAILESVFRAAPIGITVVRNRIAQSVNRRLCAISGYDAQDIIGKNARMFYPDDTEFDRAGRDLYSSLSTRKMASVETRLCRKDGELRNCVLRAAPLEPGNPSAGVVVTVEDITEQKRAEKARERLIAELREAMHNIKQLKELLPICAACKKIRDDQGYWNEVEIYIEQHTDAKFSHGICPECAKKLYPDL